MLSQTGLDVTEKRELNLLLYTQKKNCTAEGCTLKQLKGKLFCGKHLPIHGRQKMTKETQALVRSNCCNASCSVGEKHEYGEQYCNKCKLTCIWKLASAGTARAVPLGDHSVSKSIQK